MNGVIYLWAFLIIAILNLYYAIEYIRLARKSKDTKNTTLASIQLVLAVVVIATVGFNLSPDSFRPGFLDFLTFEC